MDNLNKTIMDKLNALGSNYADYQTAVEGAPQFEADTRATVFADQGLKDLMGGFSDKVMELYNYDKNKASAYSAPVNVQGTNYVADPMIAESATQSGFSQIAKEKEGAWQLYETRKNLLGSVVDKALKLYEAKLEGKKMNIEQAKDERDFALDAYSKVETLRLAKERLELDRLEKKGSSGSKRVDDMDDNQVIQEFTQKYGQSSYFKLGGTSEERNAYARAVLAQGETGETPLYLSPAADQTKMSGYSSGANYISKFLSTYFPDGEPGFVQSLKESKTGPIIGMLGAKGKYGQLRVALENFTPEKINQLYGGALTDNEVKRLDKFMPNSKENEQTVYRKLNEMLNQSKMMYEEKMRSTGYPEDYIQRKIKTVFGEQGTQTSTTPGSIKVGKYEVVEE